MFGVRKSLLSCENALDLAISEQNASASTLKDGLDEDELHMNLDDVFMPETMMVSFGCQRQSCSCRDALKSATMTAEKNMEVST